MVKANEAMLSASMSVRYCSASYGMGSIDDPVYVESINRLKVGITSGHKALAKMGCK